MRTRTMSTRAVHRGPVSERLSIKHILRRRKKTVKLWLDELGLSTYGAAQAWCNSVGVTCISEDEFVKVTGSLIPLVNDPSEGVVVVTLKPEIVELKEEITEKIESEEPQRRSKKRGRKSSFEDSGEPGSGSS